ncbi:MAG: DUF4860 domain-containing protein [Oscillospiraceae bacterium]|nr:DUF4860 domain-containing protein [Oscillospiraceae bacterium]
MFKNKSVLQTFSILLLIGIFACCALLTAALSAGALNDVSARAASSFDTRTGLLYVSQKLRACASREDARVERCAGGDALVLMGAQGTYETWIFVSDGVLCEVTQAAGTVPDAAGAQPVTDADNFTVAQTGGLFELRIESDGRALSARVFIQAQGGRTA